MVAKDPRTVDPAALLAGVRTDTNLAKFSQKLLGKVEPSGTPYSKTRLGFVTAFDPQTWTCTAKIGDQNTTIANIPILAGVIPIPNAAGQFVEISGSKTTQYTLTGMLLGGPSSVRIRKPVGEGVSNVGAVQSDDHLNFYGLPNRAYICEALLLVSQNASTSILDFLIGWNLPVGATWSGNAGPGPDLSISTTAIGTGKWNGFQNAAPGAASAFGIAKTAGQITLVPWHGTIKMGANGGLCSMCWAQNTPLSATTTVNAGSYLKVDMASE